MRKQNLEKMWASRFATMTLCMLLICANSGWAQGTSAASPAPSINAATSSTASADSPAHQLAHDILKQLIEINTTDSSGSTTVAAQAMAQRLLAAGFAAQDVKVLGPNDRKGNLVVRMRGKGKSAANKPVLFLAHLDVVEARREDWTVDPFKFTEKDGWFYGRGTTDIKDGDTELMTNLILMKKAGYVPERDIIVALTADEEGGDYNGVEWLLKNHKDLIDAEYAVNTDAGNFELEKGRPVLAAISAAEKLYADFKFESLNKGGHSSLPVRDNAIYHLAGALEKLADHEFPVETNEITRGYFAAMAKLESDPAKAKAMRGMTAETPDPAAAKQLAESSPYYNAMMRTTCVATRLEAGHANNALPQMARAIVNCRILPGVPVEQVRAELERMAGDPQVKVSRLDEVERTSPPSPLSPAVMKPLEETLHKYWPELVMVPSMDTGASDGRMLRAAGMPVYGVPGVFGDRNDVRAHGRDERVEAKWFYAGVDFFGDLMRRLTSQ